MKSPFLWFMGIFFLMGLTMFLGAVYFSVRSVQASRWPVVTGRLISAELESHSGTGTRRSTYRVVAKYEYSVEGISYTGDRIAFGYSRNGQRGRHRDILNKLKVAKTLGVRYSPSNPAVSTLSVGFHEFHKSWLVGGLFWISLIILVLSVAWQFTKTEPTVKQNLIIER